MKNSPTSRYHFKQLLRQFYQIHDAAVIPTKITAPTVEAEKQANNEEGDVDVDEHGSVSGGEDDGGNEDEEEEDEGKKQFMRTTSTEIVDSKLRVWEESTLRQIQEKSEGYNSIEKYSFAEQQGNESNTLISKYNQKSPKKPPKKPKNPPKKRRQPKQKKPKPRHKDEQLVVSLKYGEGSAAKVYHIGMKILNKEWFKYLDSIHRI